MSESYKLGTYQLGYRWVDVVVDPNLTGGNFNLLLDNFLNSKITIGFDYSDQEDVWAVLIHEALEALMVERQSRLRKSNSFAAFASDIYIFHFDHNQFTEIASRLGVFIASIKNDFDAACELFLKK